MPIPNYQIWAEENETPHVCELNECKGLDAMRFHALYQGESMKSKFPADAEFRMDPDFPDNTVLADTLNNIDHVIIGSERLKSFLEAQGAAELEYLKVTIRDHKGKKAAQYFIAHPVGAIDCIDHQASGSVFSRAVKTKVDKLKRLVLRPETIDPDRKIFRVSGYPKAILVREDLALAIGKAFKGIKFKKLAPKTK